MKLSIKKGIVVLLCMMVLGGLVYVDSIGELEYSKTELSFSLNGEVLHAWQGEDAYYLFLPSYAKAEEVKLLSYATEFEIPQLQNFVIRGNSLAGLPMDEKMECVNVATKEAFSFCIMRSANLPAVFIETDSGTRNVIWTDKEAEENGKIQVFDETGTKQYSGGLKSIKGRGNYSFAHYDKKPLSITCKEEVAILGLGMGEKYSLVSNASDPTLLRNELTRKMEAALKTEYANNGRFIDLYINGEYLGNYYLCENIEIGSGRIAITDLEEKMDALYRKFNYASFKDYETDFVRAKQLTTNPSDISGGYLVEREFSDRYKLEYTKNPSSFITEGEEHFIVKSPLYCSDEQINYIKECFDRAEAALLESDGRHPDTGEMYSELIDVDSFVKKYLVEEVSKNYDGGISSSFFYKDSDSADGRIKAGPIWDCDMTFGNYLDWMEYFSKDPEGVSRLALHDHASPWFAALYEKEEIYTKICLYYREMVAPFMEEQLKDGIDEYKEYLEASARMNHIRWQEDLKNNPYYSDWETEYEELKEFISKRKNFLDEVWVEQIPYYIVTFKKDGAILEISYRKDGETLGEFPVMNTEDAVNWCYGNGKEASVQDVIKEDTVLETAKE